MSTQTVSIDGRQHRISRVTIAAKRFFRVMIDGQWRLCLTAHVPDDGIVCPGCGCYCMPTARSKGRLCPDCDAELQFDRNGLPPERHIIQIARDSHDQDVSESESLGGVVQFKHGGGKS